MKTAIHYGGTEVHVTHTALHGHVEVEAMQHHALELLAEEMSETMRAELARRVRAVLQREAEAAADDARCPA